MPTTDDASAIDWTGIDASRMDGFKERSAPQEEDESQILASLGSTAASASTYEQSVLRDAKLKSAPQIVLPYSTIAANIVNSSKRHHSSNSSLVPCGEEQPRFPDLSSLAPSTASASRRKRDVHAGVPHVLKVLSRTRDLLQSTLSTSNAMHDGERRREIDMLYMKEQVLLSYLTDVVGLKDDDAVIPHRKCGSGIRRLQTDIDAGNLYYGNSGLNDVTGNKSDAAQHSTEVNTATHTDSSSNNRLNRIKNGETVDYIERRPLKRNTMMSLKSQMRIENGLTPLKTMDEERFDEEKSRKRRADRKKRRLQRQRATLGMQGSREEDDADDAEAEFVMPSPGILKPSEDNAMDITGEETTMEHEPSKIHNDQTKSTKNGVHWAKQDEPPNAKKRTHTKVFCPICQLSFSVDNTNEGGELPDEFLAKHIAECQKLKNARNGGRTLRKRSKPTTSYFDEGEVEDEDDRVPPVSYDGSEVVDCDTNYESKTSPHRPIDDMDEFDYEERVDDWIERGLDRMKSMAERDDSESPPGSVVYQGGLEIPAWINDRLFPYQRAGVRWMWELHCQGVGGVVGDEMGLGKTVQVSSFLGALAINRIVDSVLIIAPATMLSHWLRELEVWAPGLRRILIHRSGESDGVSRVISRGMLRSLKKWLINARADRVNEPIDDADYNQNEEHSFCGTGYVVVTTYESIRRSTDDWTNHNWSYVVLDEGQKIKNPDADITLACKRLRTPHRLLLSGTPIQNDLRELWSLFDFIIPSRLGTLPAFEAEFSEPIRRGGYSNATPMQVQLAYRCALVLRDLINPYLLRRQKKDVSEVSRMPGKTEQVLFCRLTPKQRSLYEEYLKSDEVTGVMRGSVQLLKAVTVLRKICNHTDLVVGRNGDFASDDESASSSDEDVYDHDKIADQSGKLQVLSKILPLWKKQGHKVIIFTQWRKMLSIIEQFVIHQDWVYARLDGNTNIAARQRLVDKFNNDDSYFCMLMTTRTGGIGLNITGANRVLLYDPDFNPATDAQARERAWRFGQTRPVTVYRLITAGSIEEKIYQRQIFKTALTNQILQDPKQRRLFSQKDLRDLFTLKVDSNNTTETGELTKGGGVMEISHSTDLIHDDKESQPCDNNSTLKVVIKSKGICGVFDHDFVEEPSAGKKPLSVIEIEDNARKLAMKAVLALKASSQNQKCFEPTWTGSEETRPYERVDKQPMSSSTSLIANLQNRRVQIASNGQSGLEGPVQDAETAKYSGLLLRMKNYIRRTMAGPTTRELLAEFKDVPNCDAAVFRSLLRSIATIKDGKWILSPETA